MTNRAGRRCCLCRGLTYLERTDLPGSGWRCRDHVGCKRRVRETIAAHKGLAEVCDEGNLTR